MRKVRALSRRADRANVASLAMMLRQGRMRRRDLIAALGVALVFPCAVRAQQPGPVRRVGMLLAQAIDDDPEYEGRVSAVVEGLRGLGWIDGRNLKVSIVRA